MSADEKRDGSEIWSGIQRVREDEPLKDWMEDPGTPRVPAIPAMPGKTGRKQEIKAAEAAGEEKGDGNDAGKQG